MSEKGFNPFLGKRAAIEEGLAEYRSIPRSKEGAEMEVGIEDYEREKAEKPLRREDIEKDVENFVKANLEKLLPYFLDQKLDYSQLIEKLGLTNEDMGNLGAGYFIRVVDGKKRIFVADESCPEGREQYESWDDATVKAPELLALTYLKKNIRVDTLPQDVRGGGLPRRYYYKPHNRYLCSNDFGMRAWNEDEKRMVDGDVSDGSGMVRTIADELKRISENVRMIPGANFETRAQELFAARGISTYIPWNATEPQKIEHQSQIDSVWEEAKHDSAQEVTQALENPKNLDLILGAVPVRKIYSQLRFRSGQIFRDIGLPADDTEKAYQAFSTNPSRYVGKLIHESKEEGIVPHFTFGKFERPVLVDTRYQEQKPAGQLAADAKTDILERAKRGVKDELARRMAAADPNLKAFIEARPCERGPGSPYFYSEHGLYDFATAVGSPEKAAAVLDNATSYQFVWSNLDAVRTLKEIGVNVAELEVDAAKKQMHEVRRMRDLGILSYFETREKDGIDRARMKLGAAATDKSWLELIGTRRAKELFREGKRMRYLAHKVGQLGQPAEVGTDENRNDQRRKVEGSEWARYETAGLPLKDDQVQTLLNENGRVIGALMAMEDVTEWNAETNQMKVLSKAPSVKDLLLALNKGRSLRGAALAMDKRQYLEAVLAEGFDEEKDKEVALANWSKELRGAVSQDELDIYYEYANDYIYSNPSGMVKYATWRASAEGKTWDEVFKEQPKAKSDLDFRLCLAAQTEEVRGWYKQGAEYVGGAAMQAYILRFNVTRDTEGRVANLHDTLYWVTHITNLEKADARQMLSSIQTMDENREFIELVPRYRKEDDKLKRGGPIQSIRELRKRVQAIESDLDFSTLPDAVQDITGAPGFNAMALKELQREARFRDLVEGKLDKEQPFKPHRRLFAGRDLTEALKEGLGSQKQKIKGTAQDTKGLYHALNQLVKDRKIGEKRMQVTDLFEGVPTDLEEEIIKLLLAQRVDVGPTVEAQVHTKSDPEGWVCGNYTDCCMPFGASNNTDYMFNKGTQYFTIKYNGRTVAQSVVVDGRDNNDRSDVVILDNIEIAHNYKNLSPLLARVYQTFWTEYTSKAVKVGTGYSDLIPPGGKLESNHYSPKNHLSYSDASGSQIYDMPKMRGLESMDKQVTFANLSERDAELIAKMEKEAYPEGLVMGKSHIAEVLQKQRDLEVPGAASSFVVRQGKEPAGYLLVLPEESERTGERVAHIYDMAVLPKFRGFTVAAKMMERVLDVASAYGVAIEAEARASTTYALLMNRRVRDWLKTKGFEVTTTEKMPEYLGGEDFYFVRLENRKRETAGEEEV